MNKSLNKPIKRKLSYLSVNNAHAYINIIYILWIKRYNNIWGMCEESIQILRVVNKTRWMTNEIDYLYEDRTLNTSNNLNKSDMLSN